MRCPRILLFLFLAIVLSAPTCGGPEISNPVLSATPPPDETPTTSTVCNDGREPDQLPMLGYFVFDFYDPNGDIIALDVTVEVGNQRASTTLSFLLLFQKSGRTYFIYSHSGYPAGTPGKMTWRAIDAQGNESNPLEVAFTTGNEEACGSQGREPLARISAGEATWVFPERALDEE
ncbi:MAG: hypothetical protein D6812_09635 [Deltaproteobacteria bacterium]|nr:MAG: hypothetical protein D6812_09635 [Deltaproteobacteria bacterium]